MTHNDLEQHNSDSVEPASARSSITKLHQHQNLKKKKKIEHIFDVVSIYREQKYAFWGDVFIFHFQNTSVIALELSSFEQLSHQKPTHAWIFNLLALNAVQIK